MGYCTAWYFYFFFHPVAKDKNKSNPSITNKYRDVVHIQVEKNGTSTSSRRTIQKKTVTFSIQFKSFHHQDEMMIRRLNNRLVGWLVSCLIAIRLTIVIKKSNSNERHKIKWILMMAMKNNQLAMITNGYCVCVVYSHSYICHSILSIIIIIIIIVWKKA